MFARTISNWLTPPVSPWRVILLATIPFWAYLTLHDILIYESYVLGGTPREMIASPMVRALQHLLLLPIALIAYRFAWRVGWPEQGRGTAAAWHILFAFLFACFARPANASPPRWPMRARPGRPKMTSPASPAASSMSAMAATSPSHASHPTCPPAL